MIYHHSITVDFDTDEPYAVDTIKEATAQFVSELGGDMTGIEVFQDKEDGAE